MFAGAMYLAFLIFSAHLSNLTLPTIALTLVSVILMLLGLSLKPIAKSYADKAKTLVGQDYIASWTIDEEQWTIAHNARVLMMKKRVAGTILPVLFCLLIVPSTIVSCIVWYKINRPEPTIFFPFTIGPVFVLFCFLLFIFMFNVSVQKRRKYNPNAHFCVLGRNGTMYNIGDFDVLMPADPSQAAGFHLTAQIEKRDLHQGSINVLAIRKINSYTGRLGSLREVIVPHGMEEMVEAWAKVFVRGYEQISEFDVCFSAPGTDIVD